MVNYLSPSTWLKYLEVLAGVKEPASIRSDTLILVPFERTPEELQQEIDFLVKRMNDDHTLSYQETYSGKITDKFLISAYTGEHDPKDFPGTTHEMDKLSRLMAHAPSHITARLQPLFYRIKEDRARKAELETREKIVGTSTAPLFVESDDDVEKIIIEDRLYTIKEVETAEQAAHLRLEKRGIKPSYGSNTYYLGELARECNALLFMLPSDRTSITEDEVTIDLESANEQPLVKQIAINMINILTKSGGR